MSIVELSNPWLSLDALVFALKLWCHYLYVVHVDIFTDPMSLQNVFTQKDPNLRQKRCLQLLKDYDMSIPYHPGKANVVVYYLGRLTMVSISQVEEENRDLAKDVHKLAHLESDL